VTGSISYSIAWLITAKSITYGTWLIMTKWTYFASGLRGPRRPGRDPTNGPACAGVATPGEATGVQADFA
jgi:hypothetical protein